MYSQIEASKALDDFLGTFAFVKSDMPDWKSLSAEAVTALAQEIGWRALQRGRIDMLTNSSIDSWFRVVVNGIVVDLPRYTLMTMRHCITADVEPSITLRVETNHWDRMRAEFGSNTVFLDIGAATGAMSIPYALGQPDGLRIVAFEPSKRARHYLEATALRNKVGNITVMPVALSDASGKFDFMELPEDAIGTAPFLPEASRLQVSGEALYSGASSYAVDVVTLDSLASTLRLGDAETRIFKLDVEGFEEKVLMGAIDLIKEYKPFISIDIHIDPHTGKLTDDACLRILGTLGYKFERLGHVLIGRH